MRQRGDKYKNMCCHILSHKPKFRIVCDTFVTRMRYVKYRVLKRFVTNATNIFIDDISFATKCDKMRQVCRTNATRKTLGLEEICDKCDTIFVFCFYIGGICICF